MTIQEIKSKVLAMMREREAFVGPEEKIFNPSQYWKDFCSYFNYMFDLSEESYSKIRLHTYHLTGDHYQHYYFGDPDYFKSVWHLDTLTQEIPANLVLNEPEGGIGFSYGNGRLISYDIVKYQRIVNYLYKHGALNRLLQEERKNRGFILEIGAGYGGLVHHLSKGLKNVTCVIVDLPETLLFSAAYLKQHNPDKKIYLYDKTNFKEKLQISEAQTHDFILLPNYQLHSLDPIIFDLVINVSSFQEMRKDQITVYLDFIQNHCSGILLSSNSTNPQNNELKNLNLSKMLNGKFDVTEVFSMSQKDKTIFKLKQFMKSIAVKLGILHSGFKVGAGEDYIFRICKPKKSSEGNVNGAVGSEGKIKGVAGSGGKGKVGGRGGI